MSQSWSAANGPTAPGSSAGAASTESERSALPRLIEFSTGTAESNTIRTGRLMLVPGPPSSSTVCVHRVPGIMTAPDFCIFVAPFHDTIRYMRLLRPKEEKNCYVVVLKFATPADALRFSSEVEGRDFLVGLQLDEKCHVSAVETASIDVPEGISESASGSDTETGKLSFPGSLVFPVETETSSSTSSAASSNTGSALGFDAKCPVCQDSLDTVSAGEGSIPCLVTTLCNHTLHAQCLAKWTSDKCPVCRHANELIPEATSCMSCGETRGLWMCIVCAYVGCGFYERKHAEEHSRETQHPFAVNIQDYKFSTGDQIAAGSVWDYTSKRFVQRLISSEDGKVVEVSPEPAADSPSGESGRSGCGHACSVGDSGSSSQGSSSCRHGTSACKPSRSLDVTLDADVEYDRGYRAAIYASNMDALVGEYRAQLENLEAEHKASLERSEEAEKVSREAIARKDDQLAEAERIIAELRDELKTSKKQLTRRAGEYEKEGKGLKEKNAFLKTLNESLLRDKQGWKEEVDRLSKRLEVKERECAEKEEQLRDMMLHLEAQAKFSEASSSGCRANATEAGPSEASGGDILGVGPSPREKLARRSRRR